MGQIFEDLRSRGAGGRVGQSAAFPSGAALAVHGSSSVPPELVAALSGSDYGNLEWLGSTAGEARECVRFDLRERPSFY